jgi:CHAT domain-containing protein/tetratricopeptide (TPR) repeat protein
MRFPEAPMSTCLARLAILACTLVFASCTGGFETDPLVEFSTDVVVQGDAPQSLARPLRAGVYVVEVRERDIDLRIRVEADGKQTELGDAYLRHGLHRAVVSLDAPATLRLELASVDQRSWRGAAGVRILRWPRPAADAVPDERLLGFTSMGEAAALVATDSPTDWAEAVNSLRSAAEYFRHANDVRSLGEAEYQRGWVECDLLLDFDDARRDAEAALAHFRAVDDELWAQRASLLIALAEGRLAAEQRGGERELRLANVSRRLVDAQRYFEDHEETTDALRALDLQAMSETIRGRNDRVAAISQVIRRRAHARGDKLLEAEAIRSLADIANRNGETPRAARMFESMLPFIERDRTARRYATFVGSFGNTLTALGDFDRALMFETEALELFTARGDSGQVARTLTALGAIHFRTGNVERALDSLRRAQPLYERAGDVSGQAASLQLLGNAAATLGLHDLALEHLRKAERISDDIDVVEGARVLIASQLRILGDLSGADVLLAGVLQTRNERTRADALAERARLRQRQRRPAEALSDLRLADAAYARLQLDFNRIDTSAALALALLESGDVAGAGVAADTAVMMERRIRVKSANPELRAGFLSASYAPYEARIEVDLADGSRRDTAPAWKAFRTAEAIRARSLSDRMSSRALSGDSVGASAAPTIRESQLEVQAALPADTAVLAYFVGDVRSHAWLLTRAELRHAVLPGRRALRDIVTTFVDGQRSGARSARDSVFAPLLGNLLNGVRARRLMILPDGPLNGLPFAALPIPHGESRELLVDRFVVTAAPSLALSLHAAPASGEHARVAVISDPVYTADDRRLAVAPGDGANYRGAEPAADRFARLPYSAIEARAVVRAFAGMEVIELAGFNATARRVVELPSRDLGVLHFATHAVTRRDVPEQSALLLSEYAADGTSLPVDRLTAEDITRTGLRADIVVLSGCATGDGRELRGEGVLGLTYRFLANGSSTVVASLWPVEDALTARFMEEFYTAYRATGRAPDALRTAQLRTRGTAAAAVWASFVVRANALP